MAENTIETGSLRHLKRDIDHLYDNYPECRDAAVAFGDQPEFVYKRLTTMKVCRNEYLNNYYDHNEVLDSKNGAHFNCVVLKDELKDRTYEEVSSYLETKSKLTGDLLSEEKFVKHLNTLSISDAAKLIDTQSSFSCTFYYMGEWMLLHTVTQLLKLTFSKEFVEYLLDNDFEMYDNKYPQARIAKFTPEQYAHLSYVKISELSVPRAAANATANANATTVTATQPEIVAHEAFEEEWNKLKETSVGLCAICPVCGGSSMSFCECAKARWMESRKLFSDSQFLPESQPQPQPQSQPQSQPQREDHNNVNRYDNLYTKSQVCLNCNGVMSTSVAALATDTVFYCNLCGFKFRKF